MIILASASAVRARLLRHAGVSFTAASSGVDELDVKARLLADGAGPRAIAEHLAREKALAIPAAADDLIIGADQTLELDGQLIDKAEDLAAARARLEQLRGRTHTLHAAAALACGGEVIWQALESPVMTMRAWSDGFVDHYLRACGEEVLSSVGCYHLEGRGAQLFEAVDGDYFAVLGLPMLGLLSALRAAGGLAT